MDKTRVLLAEDHTIVRKGLRSLLDKETGIEVVGEAEDGREAIVRHCHARAQWPGSYPTDQETFFRHENHNPDHAC